MASTVRRIQAGVLPVFVRRVNVCALLLTAVIFAITPLVIRVPAVTCVYGFLFDQPLAEELTRIVLRLFSCIR